MMIRDASGRAQVADPSAALDIVNKQSVEGYIDSVTDQELLTTSSPTFVKVTTGSIDTGNGATEVFDMDQDVKTTDSPTFAGLSLTGDIFTAGAKKVKAHLQSTVATGADIYNFLLPFLPNHLDEICVNGAVSFLDSACPLSYARRSIDGESSIITLFILRGSSPFNTTEMSLSAGSTAVHPISISV
jgi:hypothetical protein